MVTVVVSNINAPKLKSVTGAACVNFNIDYEKHLRNIDEMNRNSSRRISPSGYKACLSRELLENL